MSGVRDFVEQTERTNLGFWLPRIFAAGLPIPETQIVTTDIDLTPILDGQDPGADAFIRELRSAIGGIGSPCFLRTGYLSGKHDWDETCFLADPDDLERHIANLVEASALADIMGLPTDTWAVREMIPTSPMFRCLRYHGMPVVPEWRLFVSDSRVVHVQFYWPEDALEQGEPDHANWLSVYRWHRQAMSHDEAVSELGELAIAAGQAAGGGYWSVDFLWSEPRKMWYLTDMADGDLSYRYDS